MYLVFICCRASRKIIKPNSRKLKKRAGRKDRVKASRYIIFHLRLNRESSLGTAWKGLYFPYQRLNRNVGCAAAAGAPFVGQRVLSRQRQTTCRGSHQGTLLYVRVYECVLVDERLRLVWIPFLPSLNYKIYNLD